MTDEMNAGQQPYDNAAYEQPNPYATNEFAEANPYAQPQQPAQTEQFAQPQQTVPPQQPMQPQYVTAQMPQPVVYDASGQPLLVGSKNKIVAALLAFFLGTLGIHNFYLGKTTIAIIQLIMGTVGWLLILPGFAAAIWAFVEFILILVSKPGTSYHKDGQGFELQD